MKTYKGFLNSPRKQRWNGQKRKKQVEIKDNVHFFNNKYYDRFERSE